MEHKKTMRNRIIHHNMALVGGFLGSYAILCRADFLGNAQTANLIYLVHAILGQNAHEVLLRLIALALYFTSTMLFVVVRDKSNWNVQKVSLGIDLIAIIALGLIPLSVNPIIGLFPIFFSMAFQWNAFPGGYGYVSSTIFSTNNTRQVALSVAEYFCHKDKRKIHKAVFFLGSILCFHLGVAIAYIVTKYASVHGVWLACIFLLPAALLVCQEEQLSRLDHSEILTGARKEG